MAMPSRVLGLFIVGGIAVTALALVLISPESETGTTPQEQPTARATPVVRSECAPVAADVARFEAEDDVAIESFTVQVVTENSVPVPGLCLTVMRDLAPVAPPEFIATCMTNRNGRCTVQTPGGLLNVYVGLTSIDGALVSPEFGAQGRSGLIDAASTNAGITFFFPAEAPSENYLVVMPGQGDYLTLKYAQKRPNGRIAVLNPDLPNWVQEMTLQP